MIDEEGLAIDLAEATGKAGAAIAVQSALAAMLITKPGRLTQEDIATIAGHAEEGLPLLHLTPQATVMAKAALTGFVRIALKQISTN